MRRSTAPTMKALKTALAGFALAVTPMLTNHALAETQVRIQTTNLNSDVSEGYNLSVEEWSAQTREVRENKPQTSVRRSSRHASTHKPLVWVANIGTLLFDDLDGDGYHSGFSLTIDVDSEFGDTDVYTAIYLAGSNEELNLLHTSERFTIYGSLIGDEYRIDTELRNNFPTDYYDITIDVHDAWSEAILDTVNARLFSNLDALPLESANNESAHSDYPDDQDNHDDYYDEDGFDQNPNNAAAGIVITEYTGALHPAVLLMVLTGLFYRRKTRKSST